MNSLWPSRAANDSADGAKGTVDVADTGVADVGPGTTRAAPNPPASRPPLHRNQSQPEPPAQPPPPPSNQPADSLSLAQLRRIVSEFPRDEAVAYDFEYSDTGPHAEEIDEWFVYNFWQWVRLNNAQRAFEWQWEHDIAAKQDEITWDEASDDFRSDFVRKALDGIKSADVTTRAAAIGRSTYLVLGRWHDTAGGAPANKSKARHVAAPAQLAAMKASVKLLAELDGMTTVWTALRNAYEGLWADETFRPQNSTMQDTQDELMNLMTIMYICIQEALSDRQGMAVVRSKLLKLEPHLTTFMLSASAKLRWQEGNIIPVSQTLSLLWKSILLEFGGSEEIAETKRALRETSVDDKEKDVITASPLDYHVFRQEITSKYPAYVPPQPAIPLEADNTSLLPPLPNHPTRNNGANGIYPARPGTQSGGASILHQPVHIATPAPSPPPSPAVGKGGKKQNYQTNQNFPFMYPPLDASSNSAGGKGGAGLQEFLVGRKWEGSDVPASILEAGELFSKRVRMTRVTRQLWDEREKFQRFERGWDPSDDAIEDFDLDALDLDEDVDDEKLLDTIDKRRKKAQGLEIDYGPIPDVDLEVKRRLEAIEDFYTAALPQLQSLAIVLMKGVLYNVTACITQPTNGQQHPGMPGGNNRPNGGPALNRSHESSTNTNGTTNQDNTDASLEDVDAARRREIESKASTGIILLLLKWLKLSHVLKFEYLTQLLLDSNYLPLVLKLFAHQDIQQVVDSKTDRLEHSFFQFSNQRANPTDKVVLNEPTEIDGAEDEESEDEAAPPPIKRQRSPPLSSDAAGENSDDAKADGQAPSRPEVDELGYPVNPLPKEPITDFSRRNFFALINYLRIMQKICKNKAHRNLLLVQYKSSAILRKALKVPQNELRLYTLKLFKNQVPYCGRKWRQSNMRVITAVYLHCRPELRDEWLAGSDVDAEVEEALPLEQALRSLTHWFNVRRYPDQMADDIREALRDEQDFFKRELDKLEVWGDASGAQGDGGPGEWEAQGGVAWG
ncbi:N1221-domain-containing protein [Xylariomycetidae sp. FL2044]|nr:N1221-domain-containing protein [Xylariomycetidae sp. FL2044]